MCAWGKPLGPAPLCACGCGQLVTGKKSARQWRQYLRNHAARVQPTGDRAYRWKGGEVRQHGYVLLFRPDHPRADRIGYVRRSLLVVEEVLGRALTDREIVHHKNQHRDDDRPENLEVLPSQSAHIAHHNRHIRRAKKLTESEVSEIKRLLLLPQTPRQRRRGRKGVTGRPADPGSALQIAKRFRVSHATIKAIKDGRAFSYVRPAEDRETE